MLLDANSPDLGTEGEVPALLIALQDHQLALLPGEVGLVWARLHSLLWEAMVSCSAV